MTQEIDISVLRDGKLHLIGFCGDKFVYLVEDPNGSEWLIHEALANKFPLMVLRMLGDQKLTDAS